MRYADEIRGRKLPEFWPFDNQADWLEWQAIETEHYKLAAIAHDKWLAAKNKRVTA